MTADIAEASPSMPELLPRYPNSVESAEVASAQVERVSDLELAENDQNSPVTRSSTTS